MKTYLTAALAMLTLGVPAQEVIRHVYRNNASVRGLIQAVGQESTDFRETFMRRYQASFQPNWRKSDEAKKAVLDLDKALGRVESRNRSGEKPRYLRDDVKTAAARATALDRMFRNPDNVLETMRSDWKRLRADVETLAEMYDLPDPRQTARVWRSP